MTTTSPYAKVWKASPALLSAICSIPIKDIPKHREAPWGIAEQVDTTRTMGYVECLTCQNCGAHNDWNETFGLVCLSGRGEFVIGDPDGTIWGQNFADAKHELAIPWLSGWVLINQDLPNEVRDEMGMLQDLDICREIRDFYFANYPH